MNLNIYPWFNEFLQENYSIQPIGDYFDCLEVTLNKNMLYH